MASTIQIHNVPEETYQALKTRADLAGMSLSEYLLGEMTRIAHRPTVEALRARLDSRRPVAEAFSTVDLLRNERNSR
jgi:hypothetical protein